MFSSKPIPTNSCIAYSFEDVLVGCAVGGDSYLGGSRVNGADTELGGSDTRAEPDAGISPRDAPLVEVANFQIPQIIAPSSFPSKGAVLDSSGRLKSGALELVKSSDNPPNSSFSWPNSSSPALSTLAASKLVNSSLKNLSHLFQFLELLAANYQSRNHQSWNPL